MTDNDDDLIVERLRAMVLTDPFYQYLRDSAADRIEMMDDTRRILRDRIAELEAEDAVDQNYVEQLEVERDDMARHLEDGMRIVAGLREQISRMSRP